MTDMTRGRCSAARFYLYWLLALAAAVAAFCSYIHVRHRVISLGYDIGRERSARARLEGERRDLRMELASYESPADLAEVARFQLGLDVPGETQVVEVERPSGGAGGGVRRAE